MNDNLNQRITKLKKQLQNKRVLIYGTGKLFQSLLKDYHLGELNIIGIIDKKYEFDESITEDFGYKVVHISEIYLQKADCILICLAKPQSVEKQLKSLFKNIKILSIYNIPFLEKLKTKLKPIRRKNRFVLIKQNGKRIYNPKIKNLKVNMWGENSSIEIYEPFTVKRQCYISCGNNSKVTINAFNEYKTAQILVGNDNKLEVGSYTTIEEASVLLRYSQNTSIRIGKDCMISYGVIIRTTDAHRIYNIETAELANPNKNVIIGQHVWIGAKAMVLKGSKIPSNCIIGAYSLVNKKFTEENCIIAGNPAKIIKNGTNWERCSPA